MLYLAIDGGGTKTEGILADESQTILAHRTIGPSNPHDISPEASVRVLTSLVRDLICDVSSVIKKGKQLTDISLFAGIAGVLGYREALQAALATSLQAVANEIKTIRFSHVGIDSDIIILFAAEIPKGDGACVISGTGSVCFLRSADAMSRIGGWGYLLDSGGNGYSIGRDALEAALRAHDGRGPSTTLTSHLHHHLGRSVPEALTDIYAGGKAYIAACAPSVFAAADEGDAVARHILRCNAEELAALISAARQKSNHPAALPVVLGGGLCRNRPDWVAFVRQSLPSNIAVELRVASRSPVMGALTLAMHQAI